MPDPVLMIYETGSLQHPCYLITDPDDRFWTGSDWSKQESEGRLYVSINDANEALQEILRSQYADKPVRRYVAPVYVDLYSENELSLQEITDWLVNVSRLIITENGPLEGTLALGRIDWSQLHRIND